MEQIVYMMKETHMSYFDIMRLSFPEFKGIMKQLMLSNLRKNEKFLKLEQEYNSASNGNKEIDINGLKNLL